MVRCWAPRCGRRRQEAIAFGRGILSEQPVDFSPNVVLAGTQLSEHAIAHGRVTIEDSFKRSIYVLEAIGIHCSKPPSWLRSQARAKRQSVSTVVSDTPSVATTWGTDIPPKNRSVTTCAWRG